MKIPFLTKTQQQLDAQEAYNLWDMLQSRYGTLEQIQIFQNFIHDIDFSTLVKITLYTVFEDQINELEKEMSNYGVSLPNRPPKTVRIPTNIEAVEDRFIAGIFLTVLQENVSMHLRAIRASLTNDSVRRLFIKYLRDELGLYDKAIKYFKLKGWVGTPPIYPQSPPGTQEKIDTGEAFHLWDHLSSRYDSLQITQIYRNFAHDPDFATVLLVGLMLVLEKQVNILEKEMDHFGLPLPPRPPKTAVTVQNKDVLTDELMFRQVFTGMQFMLELHSSAIKQNATNDRMRKIYSDFLWEELTLIDAWIKYGNAKGWLRPTPRYKESSS